MIMNYFPFPIPREEQVFALTILENEYIPYEDKKFSVLELPTGVGKSGIGYCIAKYYESMGITSTLITKTKILQDQYCEDFHDISPIKGKSNYPNELDYISKRALFDASKVRITNYANLNNVDTMGDILIIDEAPEFIGFLSDQLVFSFKNTTTIKGMIRINEFIGEFKSIKLKSILKNLRLSKMSLIGKAKKIGLNSSDHELINFSNLAHKIYQSSLNRDEIKVLVRKSEHGTTLFINAIPEMMRLVINQHKKVVMMSANYGGLDFFLSMLGMTREDACIYSSNESPFDKDKRPIKVIKSHSIGSSNKLKRMEGMTSEVIDSILDIEHSLDNNGLIHTVSYENAMLIKEYSKYSDRMEIVRSPSQLNDLDINKGRIILSPSIEEGVSFKGDLAVYQIIAKVPIEPSMGVNAFLVRIYGKKFINWRSALRIVQMYGRIIRSEECEGTTYISDGNFSRVCGPSSKSFYPKYFFDNLKKYQTMDKLIA